MSEGWGNPIVGGTTLRIPAIQSPNFSLANQTGWAIFADGSAFFFNVTAIGTITGGSLVIDGPSGGVFIYSGTPAAGNLIGSWTGAAGTDAFGNTYSAGLSVNQGLISGVGIDSTTITNSTFQGDIANNTTMSNPNIVGGTADDINIQFDNNGGTLLVYASTTNTVTQTVNGTYTFTVPANVTQASVTLQGAGAGGDGGTTGSGGNGGGAGEEAAEPNYPVTAGSVITYVVGNGGAGNSTGGGHGTDGGQSFFDNGGVLANGGLGNGTGGSGSANTQHHNGGSGGNGVAAGGAGGGGGSAGSTGAGGSAANATSTSGTAGGAAGAGGGAAGGAGGNNGANGSSGGSPGAGGGGAGKGTSSSGTLTKTYTPTWNGSYLGPDATFSPNSLSSTSSLFQGGETASGGAANGNQRSVMAFNRAAIAADFSGFTITSCTLTITNTHSWFNSGMTVLFDEYAGLPGSVPSSFPSGDYQDTVAQGNIAEGATHTYSLGAALGQRFATGTTNGLGFGEQIASAHPYNLNYYGSFAAGASIKMTITGTQTTAGSNTAGNGQDGKVVIAYQSSSALLCSVAPAAGTDQFGNAYKAGVWAYGNNGSAVGLVPSGNNTALVLNGGSPSVTPAGITGSTVVYGSSSGTMQLVDGADGATYGTARRSLFLGSTSGSITSATPATIQSTPVSAKSYRVTGTWFITAAGAAQFGMEINCPSGATGQFGFDIRRATTYVAEVSGAPNALVGAAVNLSAATYLVTFSGVITMTQAGTMSFQAYNVAATSSFTINAFSSVDIQPV